MKKLLSIILVVVLAFAVMPMGLFNLTASADISGYYTYYVYDGEAVIDDVDTSISGNVTIPSTLGGYPVTSIGYNAFYYCTSLKSVTIGNSVTSIGDYAFWGCTSLESVTIPNSVTSIGDGAFDGCYNLSNVYITDIAAWCNIQFDVDDSELPSSPLVYADNLYLNGMLVKNVVIPEGVENIGAYAFYNCTGLKSVSIPNSVTSIGDRAFQECYNLKTLTLSKNTTNIDEVAFVSCDLTTIYFKGTHSDWENMIYAEDEQFANAKIICICEGEHTYTDENDTSCNKYEFVKADVLDNFPDTANNAWYSNAVRYAVEAGIMTGYANGKFGTADGIQRQDFLVMLARFDGADLNEYSGGSKFGDVATGSYFEAAVNWGYKNGIVNGYENGNFGVGDMINREQIVTFLYRYAKYKGLNTDVSAQSAQTIKTKYPDFTNVSGYASDAVLWAIDRGVISGKNGNQIAPFAGAQRCEVAQIMYNINKNDLF